MIVIIIFIAVVIGFIIAKYYKPKSKSEKIWASILIPLVSGILIHLLVAACRNSGYGFAFDLGATIVWVAIPDVFLLITLFIKLKPENNELTNIGSQIKDETFSVPLHYGTGENRVDFEVSLTKKEILQMAKLREQDPERWKDNELELVKMVKKEMVVIQLEKEDLKDKQEETIDENVEKVEKPIENQTTNNESDREENIVEKTKTEEKDNETVSEVKTNTKKHDSIISKWLKILLVAILSLGLLFGFGILASFVYTKCIYPAHAKAEDEKLIQEAKSNPSKAYEIAQELFKREKNSHQSDYHDPISGKQGVCKLDHLKAGKEAANLYCRYMAETARKTISLSDQYARLLFQKHDGYCNELYDKTGIEILKYGAEQGDPNAQFTYGCYFDGLCFTNSDSWWSTITIDGKYKDEAKAAYWYSKAAEQGNTAAMGNLGHAYIYGKGVNRNEQKGLDLIVKAANLGDAFYQCRLGDFYRDGVKMQIGSHKETRKDIDGGWYNSEDKVREYWDDYRMEWVTVYQIEVADYKTILPIDMKQAQYWWKKAADNGDETAKERLQQIYE